MQAKDIVVASVFVLMHLCRGLIDAPWWIRGKRVNFGRSNAGALLSFIMEMVSWGCIVYGVCRLLGISPITLFDIVAPTVWAGFMFICTNLLLLLHSRLRETAVIFMVLMLELPVFYIIFRVAGSPPHWQTLVSSSDVAFGVIALALVPTVPVLVIGEYIGNVIWRMFLPERPQGRQLIVAAIFSLCWFGMMGLIPTALMMNASYQGLLFGAPISYPFTSVTLDALFRFLADPSSVMKISNIYRRLVVFLVGLGIDVVLARLISILATIGGVAEGVIVIRNAIKWLAKRAGFSTKSSVRINEGPGAG